MSTGTAGRVQPIGLSHLRRGRHLRRGSFHRRGLGRKCGPSPTMPSLPMPRLSPESESISPPRRAWSSTAKWAASRTRIRTPRFQISARPSTGAMGAATTIGTVTAALGRIPGFGLARLQLARVVLRDGRGPRRRRIDHIPLRIRGSHHHPGAGCVGTGLRRACADRAAGAGYQPGRLTLRSWVPIGRPAALSRIPLQNPATGKPPLPPARSQSTTSRTPTRGSATGLRQSPTKQKVGCRRRR